MIIPSIDIMNGKAVQLRQGRELAVERDDVMALAKRFAMFGEIAVVDLDAALGRGVNTELIKKICGFAECRVGGGIRTMEKANEYLSAGAKKLIIGTNTGRDFLEKLPKERIVIAIDTKDNQVVKEGWQTKTSSTPLEMIRDLKDYCSGFLFTNVNNEGMLTGAEFKAIEQVVNSTDREMTIAGGISSIDEVRAIQEKGANAQLGMALYTGRISLAESFISLLDFSKGNIPTIVRDDRGQVLMLAYSTKESLKRAFDTGLGTYYSRSREKIWTKGETSGNYQYLKYVRFDCDRDTLLFTVRQQGDACHLGAYSCFEEREFTLQELYYTLKDRLKYPRKDSYTSGIAAKESSIMQKISEETGEVINYTDRENLVWEIADLVYFVFVLMAKKDIAPEEIKNELWRRRK